jgi:hypothetical protein
MLSKTARQVRMDMFFIFYLLINDFLNQVQQENVSRSVEKTEHLFSTAALFLLLCG